MMRSQREVKGPRARSSGGMMEGTNLLVQARRHHQARRRAAPRSEGLAWERYRLLARFASACGALAAGHEAGQAHGALSAEAIRFDGSGLVAIEWGDRRRRVAQPSVRDDVFALGCILYQILVGRLAGRGPRPSPRALDPTIDRRVEAVCLKALEPRPEARYATAHALRDDLERALAGVPVWAERDSVPFAVWNGLATRPWALLAVAFVVLLVIASLGVGLARERETVAALRATFRHQDQAIEEAAEEQRRLAGLNLTIDRERFAAVQARQSEAESRARAEARWARGIGALRAMAEGLEAGRVPPELALSMRSDFEEWGPLASGPRRDLARALAALGALARDLGQPAEAVALCSQARGLFEELPDDDARTRVLVCLAEAQADVADFEGALETSRAVVGPLSLACEDPSTATPRRRSRLSRALIVQASAARALGHVEEAADAARQRALLWPDVPEERLGAARELARCAAMMDGADRADTADDALACLEEAAYAVRLPAERVRDDPAFQPFQDRPELRRLALGLHDLGFPADPFGP